MNIVIAIALAIFAVLVLYCAWSFSGDPKEADRTEAGKRWLKENPYSEGEKRAVELEAEKHTATTDLDVRPAFMREHDAFRDEVQKPSIRRLKADGTPDRRYKGTRS